MFNRTIDDIVSGLNTIANQLVTLADHQAEKTAEYSTKAHELDKKATASREEGARAVRIAKKLEEILK